MGETITTVKVDRLDELISELRKTRKAIEKASKK